MTDIFAEALRALAGEEPVMLATIIATTGSTPAAAHSKMLVTRGGASIAGTVGGGCMEGDVIAAAARLCGSGRAEIVTFHLNEENVEHGLICGGTLDILLEPLTRADIPLLELLRSRRDDGEESILVTELLPDGKRGGKRAVIPDAAVGAGHQTGTPADPAAAARQEAGAPGLSTALSLAAAKRQTSRVPLTNGGQLVVEPLAGSPRLVILGGGHVSKYLVRVAAIAGFQVTVVDDRASFADPRRFPDAASTAALPFEEAFDRIAVTPSTYLVIVTRGHRYDEELLERAIRTPARYIGMIGSKRKILTSFANIAARGGSQEALDRVHTPVGIEIGAVSAEEIAVSIVAELIRVRRGERLPLRHKSEGLRSP